MTAAIFGLLGVIVGGVLNALMAAWLEARRARAEVRSACRLLHTEFLRAKVVLSDLSTGAVRDEELRPADWGHKPADWGQFRGILATTLRPDEWSPVARGLLAIETADFLAGTDLERARTNARGLERWVDGALDVLAKRGDIPPDWFQS
jgi:hypothetical protein